MYVSGGTEGHAFVKTGVVIGARKLIGLGGQMHSESALQGMRNESVPETKP